MQTLVVPSRFNGPPDSGHGGYSAGLAAGLIDGPASVALRAPPPLEVPLAVERRDGGGVALLREGTTVIEAEPALLDVEPPDPVAVVDARAAAEHSPFLEPTHPFPTCFACGPQRAEGDGLRLFTGPVSGRDVFAVEWTPAAEFGTDGAVDPLYVWAALDCPSCTPAMSSATVVLASLTVDIRAPVPVEEPCVIGAWKLADEGRKHFTGVVLWDAAGTPLALGRALWIELRNRRDKTAARL